MLFGVICLLYFERTPFTDLSSACNLISISLILLSAEIKVSRIENEPHHEKTKFCICKTKEQISFAITAKLISAFVFATRIVQFLYFINPKFPASSHLLCLYSSVYVGPVMKLHCWFSHDATKIMIKNAQYYFNIFFVHSGTFCFSILFHFIVPVFQFCFVLY